MKRWLWIAVALLLTGCASPGYRYENDGYWTAPRRTSTVMVSVGLGACGGWGGGYGYPYHAFGYGYPYGHGWARCGYGYGHGGWYGAGFGYWHDPYWSRPWYLPGHGSPPRPAGARARQMAGDPGEWRSANPGYDDMASSRRRDLGGGNRVWSSRGGSYGPIPAPSPQRGIGGGTRGPSSAGYPSPPQGLGAGRLNTNQGLSSPSRSSPDQRPGSSTRSGGFSAPAPRDAVRSMPRERRDED